MKNTFVKVRIYQTCHKEADVWVDTRTVDKTAGTQAIVSEAVRAANKYNFWNVRMTPETDSPVEYTPKISFKVLESKEI